MVVGPARDHPHTRARHRLGHGGGVGHDLVGVDGELGGGGLDEAHRLGGDLAFDGTALAAGEDRLVHGLGIFLGGEDQPASGSAQGLVGGGGDDVGILHRIGHGLARHQPDEVGGIHHQHRPHLVGDGPEGGVVEVAGVGGVAGEDDLGAMLEGQAPHLVHVDELAIRIHPIGDEAVVVPGEVDR